MIEHKDFEALGFPPDVDIGVTEKLPTWDDNVDDIAGPGESSLDDKIDAAMKGPAYMDGNAVGHRKAVDAVQKLFEQRAATGDLRSEIERVCDGAVVEQEKKQAKLVAEAQEEMDALVGLGFAEAEVPDDIMPHRVAELRMQRLNAESKNEELQPIIEKTLADLRVPSDAQGFFSGFCRLQGLDEGLRQEILEKVIWWIHRANEQKYGAKK